MGLPTFKGQRAGQCRADAFIYNRGYGSVRDGPLGGENIHGGQHEKTFDKLAEAVSGRMSTKGCWSVKTRRNVGVKVGCYLTEASDWERAPASTKHHVMCQHGTRKAAGSSRKKALVLARTSQDWCGHCSKAHQKLTQLDEEE